MIRVSRKLAEGLREFLIRQSLSPHFSASEAEGLLVHLERCIPEDVSVPEFDEEALVLASRIRAVTGAQPALVTAVEPGPDGVRYPALRFWMRESEVGVTTRDIDLRDYQPREGANHALRAALRWVRLDHVGPAIEDSEATP